MKNPVGMEMTSDAYIGNLQSLKYRGYYYDYETGLYYLQSRYYDPVTHRFINADDTSFLGANGDTVSYNLFTYCLNNPINRLDDGGNLSLLATIGLAVGAAICITAICVLTCGVGTAVFAGAVAVGAAKGALIGAAVGATVGAGIGYATTGTFEGAMEGSAIGFGGGAVAGSIVGGTMGANSWYAARAIEFTNNPDSSEVALGRSGTYEKVAVQRDSTYFHTSDARWNELQKMKGVGEKGMWRINRAFLQQQIRAEKTFILTNNPVTDSGHYFAKEVAYLAKKGVMYRALK